MKLKDRLFISLGTGSFVYLFCLLVTNDSVIITQSNILSVFIISACAGIFAFVFDIEGISYMFSLVIHFCMMLIVVYVFSLFNYLTEVIPNVLFFVTFFMIYAFSWLILFLKTRRDAKQLNELLQNIKENKCLDLN